MIIDEMIDFTKLKPITVVIGSLETITVFITGVMEAMMNGGIDLLLLL